MGVSVYFMHNNVNKITTAQLFHLEVSMFKPNTAGEIVIQFTQINYGWKA